MIMIMIMFMIATMIGMTVIIMIVTTGSIIGQSGTLARQDRPAPR